MSLEHDLHARSNGQCELCTASDSLSIYIVPPKPGEDSDECILVCNSCKHQIENPGQMDPNHWRCLNDSMWSTTPAVQVMVWRMLDRLRGEGWPQELIDLLYLDEETMAWAKALKAAAADKVVHLDSNGTVLEAGDTVVLTQDLNVKGANFTAKRGTAVRRISLVADNPEQIEGKVNDQRIVILTKYVKKSK